MHLVRYILPAIVFSLIVSGTAAQLTNTQETATSRDEFNKAFNCDVETYRIANQKSTATAEYEKEKQDLRNGLFCSRCNNSKTAIEKGGENFRVHLQRVSGSVVQAPMEAYDQAKTRFESRLKSIEREEEQKRTECNNIRKHARELEQHEQEAYQQQLQQINTEQLKLEQKRLEDEKIRKEQEIKKKEEEKLRAEARKFKAVEDLVETLGKMIANSGRSNTQPVSFEGFDRYELNDEGAFTSPGMIEHFSNKARDIRSNINQFYSQIRNQFVNESLEERYQMPIENISVGAGYLPAETDVTINAWEEGSESLIDQTIPNESIAGLVSSNMHTITNLVYRNNAMLLEGISKAMEEMDAEPLEKALRDYEENFHREMRMFMVRPLLNVVPDKIAEHISELKGFSKEELKEHASASWTYIKDNYKSYFPFSRKGNKN